MKILTEREISILRLSEARTYRDKMLADIEDDFKSLNGDDKDEAESWLPSVVAQDGYFQHSEMELRFLIKGRIGELFAESFIQVCRHVGKLELEIYKQAMEAKR